MLRRWLECFSCLLVPALLVLGSAVLVLLLAAKAAALAFDA